jgi:acyl-CoA synthetase (NDP forming)
MTDEERSIYQDAGVPVIPDTETAMAAIAGARASSGPGEAEQDDVQASPFGPGLSGVLNDVDSITLLAEAGVPMAPMAAVNSPGEAVKAAAAEQGGPVVLKGLLSGVAHKSDLGLVVVGVEGRRRSAQRPSVFSAWAPSECWFSRRCTAKSRRCLESCTNRVLVTS